MHKKNIIIVGGFGLLGSSLSKFLSNIGHNVIIADKNLKNPQILSKLRKVKNIKLIKCDVTKDGEIDALIKKSNNFLKSIDIIIYCAYPKSAEWGKAFDKIRRKYLNQDLNNQLSSPIIFSQKIIKYFLKQGHGNIINFASIQAVAAPKFNHYENTNMSSPIEYSAMKAGIVSITKYLAKLYLKKNIRVNCVSPGGLRNNQNKNFLKKYKADCGSKGMLDASDINGIVEFLISDNSKYITGQNIIIDDGWSL